MAGMRALGRHYDIVSAPSGVDICVKDASGIGFLAVNSGTVAAILTVVAKPSFGGTSKTWTLANGFGQPNTVYTRSANTAAWVAYSAPATTLWTAASNVLTSPVVAGFMYVDFLVSQFADTYDYINVTVSGTGATLPVAILSDLSVMRTPPNMRIPSA